MVENKLICHIRAIVYSMIHRYGPIHMEHEEYDILQGKRISHANGMKMRYNVRDIAKEE